MKLTLTYQGSLPPKQRGVSPIKADLRRAFHPQIREQVARLLDNASRPHMTTEVGGHEFISPSHPAFRTGVELDILLLTPPGNKIGDVDNRLKTLIDGLTRPANPGQLQGFSEPDGGGPTFCLMDDDRLVERIGLDSRRWHVPQADPSAALVIVTATLVLSDSADNSSPVANIFWVV